MNRPQAPPERRALSDITNVTPLAFHSPIKRTRSQPLPSAPLPPLVAPQASLNDLGRAAIITLSADHQPAPVVAAKLNISTRTVHRWTTRFAKVPSLYDRFRSGRPIKVDEATKINICVTAREERFITPKGIKQLLDLRDISPRTIRRILDSVGLYGRVSRITPPLKPRHLLTRIAFGRGYGHWKYKQ